MASSTSAEMPFIISTSKQVPDSRTRKLIRSHVMIGKNLGKSLSHRRVRKRKAVSDADEDEDEDEDLSDSHDRFRALSPPLKIPRKPGSELALARFADPMDSASTADLVRFCELVKEMIFPLEKCVAFQRKTKTWFDPLFYDSAYLHATVYSAQDYLLRASGQHDKRRHDASSMHFTKTLTLLRKRLDEESKQAIVSNNTILVVTTLTAAACLANDYKLARCHLLGLRKMINIRGGLNSFRGDWKLLLHLFRCDLGSALWSGDDSLFFADQDEEPFPPFPEIPIPPVEMETCFPGSDEDLYTTWNFMQRFCYMINEATKLKQQIAEGTQLETMMSAMYRLLYMRFENGTIDEAVRLATLGLCTSAFLQCQYVRLRHKHMKHAFAQCLATLRNQKEVSSELWLWLLLVGGVSIFEREDDLWLCSWLRTTLETSNIYAWSDARAMLHEYLWIDLIFDRPGQALFSSVSNSLQGMPSLGLITNAGD